MNTKLELLKDFCNTNRISLQTFYNYQHRGVIEVEEMFKMKIRVKKNFGKLKKGSVFAC